MRKYNVEIAVSVKILAKQWFDKDISHGILQDTAMFGIMATTEVMIYESKLATPREKERPSTPHSPSQHYW